MKEASGELNMTLITIIAIAAIAFLFSQFILPKIQGTIEDKWNENYANAAEVVTEII